MKKRFLAYSTNLIKEYYPETDDIKMDEYRYNLEGVYLTFSKMLIIIPLSIIAGVFKELLILLIFFNFLRNSAQGLHATKSWICLLSSSIIFIGCPLVAKTIILPLHLKIVINIINLVLISIYAPSDTVKAPIIKKEKRKRLKIESIIKCLILISLSFIITDSTISNIIIMAILIATILILPITYKIFKLPYNNYINYINNMD